MRPLLQVTYFTINNNKRMNGFVKAFDVKNFWNVFPIKIHMVFKFSQVHTFLRGQPRS